MITAPLLFAATVVSPTGTLADAEAKIQELEAEVAILFHELSLQGLDRFHLAGHQVDVIGLKVAQQVIDIEKAAVILHRNKAVGRLIAEDRQVRYKTLVTEKRLEALLVIEGQMAMEGQATGIAWLGLEREIRGLCEKLKARERWPEALKRAMEKARQADGKPGSGSR